MELSTKLAGLQDENEVKYYGNKALILEKIKYYSLELKYGNLIKKFNNPSQMIRKRRKEMRRDL